MLPRICQVCGGPIVPGCRDAAANPNLCDACAVQWLAEETACRCRRRFAPQSASSRRSDRATPEIPSH